MGAANKQKGVQDYTRLGGKCKEMGIVQKFIISLYYQIVYAQPESVSDNKILNILLDFEYKQIP